MAKKLEPSYETNYITIEAFYKEPKLFPYNGNVLIDNIQPIILIDCDSTWSGLYEEEVKELYANNNTQPTEVVNEVFLRALIIENGKKVKFDESGVAVELSKIRIPGKLKAVHENEYLRNIAEAMKKASNKKLIIAVKGNSEQRFERMQSLEQELLNYGIGRGQFQIQLFREGSDKDESWLWSSEGNDIMMRIVSR